MKPLERRLCLQCYVYLRGHFKLTPIEARLKEDVCAQCGRKKKTFLYLLEERKDEDGNT